MEACSMKQANAQVIGMTRNPDHQTSISAAEKVAGRKLTIRERVEVFALARPTGFIDSEIVAAFASHPESSFRKRRTELTQEAVIVPTEMTRKNSAGQDCIVFMHRDHMINPPPLKKRAASSRFDQLQEEIARLKAERDSALARVAELERSNG